jgi:gas vesicle protein
MAYHDYEYGTYEMDGMGLKLVAGALAGLVVGGLIGAAVMMFYAPQSGAKTRKLLRKKAMALRHQASETVEDSRDRATEALDSAVERAREASEELRERMEKIQKRGQKTLDEQKEKVADLVGNNKFARLRR